MIGHKMVTLRCAGASAESCWNRSTAQKWLSLASFDSAPVGSCRHLLESLGAITGRVWVGWPWHTMARRQRRQRRCSKTVSPCQLCVLHSVCVCGVCVSARFRRFLEVTPIVWSFFRSFDLALVCNYSIQDAVVAWFMCSSFYFWLRTSQVFGAWCSFL